MERVGKCLDDLAKAHLCPRRQQKIYLNRGTTFQPKMNPRDLKYIDSQKERAQNAEKWRLTAGAPEPVRQVRRLPDQSLSQNGAHARTLVRDANLGWPVRDRMLFKMFDTACRQLYACHSLFCPNIASGALSEALKSKIFLGEYAPRTPSRRRTLYISFLCLPDQC